MHDPHSFINTVPHMSFVWGDDNVNFLRGRYAALQQSSLFRGMKYSEDHAQIKEWAPLVMEGRDPNQKVAATRTEIGTDVNYGEITRQLVGSLQKKENFNLSLNTEVRGFKRNADNSWSVTVADLKHNEEEHVIKAKFVFIGAGGAALKLLQETGIPEADNYGGFPVGGQFLVSENPEVVNRHLAKVYGQASVGAPPMSVLRYYDAEMRYLLEAGEEFARAHPEQAAMLNLDKAGARDYSFVCSGGILPSSADCTCG
jgi:malate dehydrogenase (quinone)